MLYPDRMLHFHGFGRHRDLYGIRKVRRTLPFETFFPPYNAFVCCQCRLVGMSVGLGVFCSSGVYVGERVSVSVCFSTLSSVSLSIIFSYICVSVFCQFPSVVGVSLSVAFWCVSVAVCCSVMCLCLCVRASLSQCLCVSISVGCGIVCLCLWLGLLVRVFLPLAFSAVKCAGKKSWSSATITTAATAAPTTHKNKRYDDYTLTVTHTYI